MTNEQLAVLIQQDNNELLPLLWENTSRLIYKKCGQYWRAYSDKFKRHGYDLSDLKQEGFIILLQALKYYNSDKSYKFSTYLNYAAKNVLSRIINNNDALSQVNTLSLEQPIDEDKEGDLFLSDIISDSGIEGEFDEVERRILYLPLHQIIDSLPEAERKAITAYYLENKTYQEIVHESGKTIAEIKSTVQKGLRILRKGEILQLLKENFMSEVP